MLIKEAIENIKNNRNKFNSPIEVNSNKGYVGQELECLITGEKSTSKLNDFEDGELKSFTINGDNKPTETNAITIISSNTIDDFLELDFEDTRLYQKIKKILFASYSKKGTKRTLNDFHYFDIDTDALKTQLKEEFDFIVEELIQTFCSGGTLKTINGDGFKRQKSSALLQIRSKDSKKANGEYNAVCSKTYGQVSDKNYAFYFRKDFLERVLKNSI